MKNKLEKNDTQDEEDNEENSTSEDEENEEKSPKKQRKFCAKIFRQELKSENAYTALKHFIYLSKGSDKMKNSKNDQDCALEFLESGGDLMEILNFAQHTEQRRNAIAPSAFEAFNIVLLKILSLFPEKHDDAEEACRQLLNKYLTSITFIFGSKTNVPKKKILLKLLSTLTTISPALAGDVLMQLNFSRDELEFLTRHAITPKGSTVRTTFIHFLVSFLMEGSTSTIVSLLEKPGLFISVFGGLIYDRADTVTLLLMATKNNVLQNKEISKTLKMNTFNTHVVQHIVNLYNWRGPENFKTKNKTLNVNPIEKQKVVITAHEFLLILCTSHKYGVIFHDPMVGLGTKKANLLVFTVLRSLDKPWENKNAGELVIKICGACPDLVHYIFKYIEPFLEPRSSEKWAKAIEFIEKLLEALGPQCVEQYLSGMTAKQIETIAELFCLPQSLVQVIKKDVILSKDAILKVKSIELLLAVLRNVDSYLKKINDLNSLPKQSKMSITSKILEQLKSKFPSSEILLKAWHNVNVVNEENSSDETAQKIDLNSYLFKLLDVLQKYREINHDWIANISNEIDPQNFLQTIQEKCSDKICQMQLKAINLFLSCDCSIFSPSNNLFSYVTPLLINIFYNAPDESKSEIEQMLHQIFSLTAVFEGSEQEIMIWLYSILEQEEFNETIGDILAESLKATSKNFSKYMNQISKLYKKSEETVYFQLSDLFENLQVKIDHENESDFGRNSNIVLSPFVVGLLEHVASIDCTNAYNFINISLMHLLHLQTSPKVLNLLLSDDRYDNYLSKYIIKYCDSWQDCTSPKIVKKIYHSKTIIVKFSKFIISDDTDFDSFLKTIDDAEWKAYSVILITKMCMFYYIQLLRNGSITENLQEKYLKIIIFLLQKTDEHNSKIYLISVFKNSVLLQLFKPAYESKLEIEKFATDFILSTVKEILKTNPELKLHEYLGSHRTKLVKEIHIVIKKCKKQNYPLVSKNLVENVKLLELSNNHCNVLIKEILCLPLTFYETSEICPVIIDLLGYILSRIQLLYSQSKAEFPIEDEIIKQISDVVVLLNKKDFNLEKLENSLHEYIVQFPHTVRCLADEIFENILLKPTLPKSSLKLATCLYNSNPLYYEIISKNIDRVVLNRELIFTLLSVLKESTLSDKSLFDKTYKIHENIILKFLNKPQKVSGYLAEQYEVVAKLINESMELEKCKEFASKHYKFDVTEAYHLEVLTTIYDKCIKLENEKNKYISNYITTFMNLLLNIMKIAEKGNEWDKVKSVSNIFNKYCNKINFVYKIEYSDNNLSKNKTFQLLSKFCLKYGIQGDSILLDVLRQLCQFTNGDQELEMIFEMATSHSECLNVLLNENDIKPVLLHLLLMLCKKCPNVKCKSHIPVWLSAYKATLSVSDQYLFQLLTLYESSDLEFHDYRPFVWGNAAANQYSVHAGIETMLYRHSSVRDVLELLNEKKINNTIMYFPSERKLIPDGQLYSNDNIDIYDPAFYLPLFSYLLSPESTARWYHFKKRGAIALVIVALSSQNKNVRSAACHVLARFYGHLESTSLGKDRLLWVHLIEVIYKGLSALEDTSMSTIVAVFLARCATVFSQPGHAMYTPLGYYIMAKECPDFTKVPEFLSLFFSSDVNYNVHQLFILEVMRDGLKTENDFKVMSKTVVFKYIMDFFNCVLATPESQKLILEVISEAVKIPFGARILTSGHSLLPWLQLSFNQSKLSDVGLLVSLINILHNLLFIFTGEQLKDHSFDILLIIMSIIDRLPNIRLSISALVKLIRVLYLTYCSNTNFINQVHISNLINSVSSVFDCQICNYYLLYGIKHVQTPILTSQDVTEEGKYYLKLLTIKWIEENNK